MNNRVFKRLIQWLLISAAMAGFGLQAQTLALEQARSLLFQHQYTQAEALLRQQAVGAVRDTMLAQAIIGVREDSPPLTAQRINEAFVLLLRASDSGYSEAVYPLAIVYGLMGQPAQAQQLLVPRAAQNDGRALYLLGRIADLMRDYPSAAYYYERGSLAGNADALNGMGYLYANGLGVAASDERAANYYTQAIIAGSVQAGVNLVALADAKRFSLAPEYRKVLLERAAQTGNAEAKRMLSRAPQAAPQATPQIPPQSAPQLPVPAVAAAAPVRVEPPKPAPPVQSPVVAPTTVAAATPALPPAPAPPPTAAPELEPLTTAQATQTYAQAMRLRRGQGMKRDLAQSLALLERAAKAGLPQAQLALAEAYELGLGTQADAAKAQTLRQEVARTNPALVPAPAATAQPAAPVAAATPTPTPLPPVKEAPAAAARVAASPEPAAASTQPPAPVAAQSAPAPAPTQPPAPVAAPSPPPAPKMSVEQAKQTYEQAMRLRRGDGVMRDFAQAANLLQQAADAGLADAQRALAESYEYGLGVTADQNKAKALRQAAAKQ